MCCMMECFYQNSMFNPACIEYLTKVVPQAKDVQQAIAFAFSNSVENLRRLEMTFAEVKNAHEPRLLNIFKGVDGDDETRNFFIDPDSYKKVMERVREDFNGMRLSMTELLELCIKAALLLYEKENDFAIQYKA